MFIPEVDYFINPDLVDHRLSFYYTSKTRIALPCSDWHSELKLRHYEENLDPYKKIWKNEIEPFLLNLNSVEDILLVRDDLRLQQPSLRTLTLDKFSSEEKFHSFAKEKIEWYKAYIERKDKHYKVVEKNYTYFKELYKKLESLDVEQYLHDKPWLDSAGKKTEKSDSVSILNWDRSTAIVLKGTETEIKSKLNDVFNSRGITKLGTKQVSEASILENRNVDFIDVIQTKSGVIIFLSSINLFTKINMAIASRNANALKFMIDEKSTGSYYIEMYEKENPKIEYINVNGKVEKFEVKGRNKYKNYTPREMIDLIARDICGQTISSLLTNQICTTYTLK